MMRLEIYDSAKKDDVVRLKLIQSDVQEIEVIAVDEQGEEVSSGALCKISFEGIERYSEINHEFGFNLTSNGSLRDNRRK